MTVLGGRRARSRFGAIALLAAGLFVVTACAGPPDPEDRAMGPLDIVAPNSPNWALAAPPGVEAASAPTLVSPVFTASIAQVLDALDAVAAADPRTERLAGAGSGETRRDYVQRSAVFRFPDDIAAEALALSEGRTSIALLSRSRYGYSDLGVNRARLERWLAALENRLPTEAP